MSAEEGSAARTVGARVERSLRRRLARAAGSAAAVALVLVATAGAVGLIHATAAVEAAERERVATPRAIEVAVAPARWVEGRTAERRFTGLVAARRGVSASFQIGGMVEEVMVDRGDMVAADAPLARLDTRRLRAIRAELGASLQEALASVDLARVEADRARSLVARGASAQAALDQATASLRQAQGRAGAIEARIEAADADLEDAVLSAPFDAVVVARLAERGDMLQAGAPALRLLEAGGLEAQVGVSAAAAARLTLGDAVTVETRSGALAATVRAVEPQIEGAARTAVAVLSLPDDATLRAGDAVELILAEKIVERGFWVPLAALTTGPRGLWALHVVEDGPNGPVVARTTVEALHAGAERAFVRGPVAEGARLITDGAHRVAPGQRVTPVEEMAGEV